MSAPLKRLFSGCSIEILAYGEKKRFTRIRNSCRFYNQQVFDVCWILNWAIWKTKNWFEHNHTFNQLDFFLAKVMGAAIFKDFIKKEEFSHLKTLKANKKGS